MAPLLKATVVCASVATLVAIASAGPIEKRTAAATADKIASLPLWDSELPSEQFSGYLDIPNSSKHLHYWLIESENDPEKDPVILWLNGGPGCSSLDGLVSARSLFLPCALYLDFSRPSRLPLSSDL